MHRSVAACLAAILELDAAAVPVPDAAHPKPWNVWRNWLAQRGLGLVPIADPAQFNWPGPWLAVLEAADGDGLVAAVAFGAPPGLAWRPLGGPEAFDAVRAGYAIAPADLTRWTPPSTAGARTAGTIEAILIAPEAEAPAVRVDRATVRAGRGLEGDRYFDGRGTFSDAFDRGHDLTLVDADVLDDVGFSAEDARRNLVTRGIDLDALVGRPFRIGDVECLGQRRCEPCAHLERVTAAAGRPGSLRALVHRGGLRADVLSDGEIRVGYPVSTGR
jgi:hypothetical protein